MSDEISDTLTWFANYTNFYSILSVLLCFFVMVVFILRLNSEHFMSSPATHYPAVQEQYMVSLHNPFSVQLVSSKCSSLKDGLHLSMSMKKRSSVKVLMGVDIAAFQTELQLPSTEIAQRFKNGESFDEKFKHCTDVGIMTEMDGDVEIYFKPPCDMDEGYLGEPPRMLYPVVVVCQLEDCEAPTNTTTIVVQFTVIHLKDSVCTLDSHIVYQFVKTNSNKLLGLQPIFMSTSESNRQEAEKVQVDNPSCETRTYVENGAKGEGCLSSRSEGVRQQCKSCGKYRQSIENIPVTIHSEMCNCDEGKLEISRTERSEVNATGQTIDNQDESANLKSDSTGNCLDSGNCAINSDNVDDLVADFDHLESCCVCQSSEIFYTLLPCRHACVCSTCIKLLDKCPICRSQIEAYFRLHNRLSELELQENLHQSTDGPRLNRWQAFNQRINEMLGFV